MASLKGRTWILFWVVTCSLVIFLVIKLLIICGAILSSNITHWIEFGCILIFLPLFLYMMDNNIQRAKMANAKNHYREKLIGIVISESQNPLFYSGNVDDFARSLTKIVADSININRSSIWLFSEDGEKLICEELYDGKFIDFNENNHISKSDYPDYFHALQTNVVIIADDAATHPKTKIFADTHIKPLNIKSVIDIPIVFRNEVIGVLAVSSQMVREWSDVEIEFIQLMSSVYAFAYAIKETINQQNRITEIENFIDKATLVSKTDKDGYILYTNPKFQEVSGYTEKDLFNKKHSVCSSGMHNKRFWSNMYKLTVDEKQIWNNLVINKKKNGDLFYIDTYIKAEFDEYGDLYGFMSIGYDVTELVQISEENKKKNAYLEYAAKIIRHDMHSGINTYLPRGINGIKRKLTKELIKEYKLEASLRLLTDGLAYTQKIYKGVYDFTNLVKTDGVLRRELCKTNEVLNSFLSGTSYKSQVVIEKLPDLEINDSLFCTAIDNLIRNGLKYNDSDTKLVKIYMENPKTIAIQDNGRGMTQDELNQYAEGYTRKANQIENGSGLGLNITVAILKEHGYRVTCVKNNIGTKMLIKL